MTASRVLLAGESWISNSTHFKGWDFFSSTVYETGIAYLQAAMREAGIDFTHLPSHQAATDFPLTLEDLDKYDVVILSDIGANTLLLHPDVWLRGKSVPNRLRLLQQWVEEGGALAMCGGYFSFSGIYGAAKFYRTPIEQLLPVTMHTFDDRVETPEGLHATVLLPDHPVVQGIDGEWPALLGYNEVMVKSEATLIAQVSDHPLLAVGEHGKGRTLVWTSDIGPHWCPEPFVTWPGYATLWMQAMEWLARKR
jgi:uncharacterized membrane protein